MKNSNTVNTMAENQEDIILANEKAREFEAANKGKNNLRNKKGGLTTIEWMVILAIIAGIMIAVLPKVTGKTITITDNTLGTLDGLSNIKAPEVTP